MLADLFSMLLAMVATTTGGVLVLLVYNHHHQQALRFWERERRLPLATKYEHLLSLVEQEEKSLEALREQVYDARQVIDEAERQKRWMDQTKEEVANLQSSREEIDRICKELETRQMELADANEQKTTLESQISELSKTCDEMKRQLEEYEQKKKELAQLTESILASREEANQLEKLKQGLTQQVEKIQRDAEGQRRRLDHELEDLKNQSTDLQQKLAKLERDCEQKQSELAAFSQQRDSLNSELSKTREEMKRHVEECERKKTELAQLTESIRSLSDEVNQLAKQKQDLTQQIEKIQRDAEDHRHRLKQELNDLKSQSTDLQQKAAKLEQDCAKKRSEMANLTQQCDSLNQEMRGLKGQIAGLKSQLPALQDLISNLSGKVPGGVKQDGNAAEDLWNPVISRATGDHSMINDERDALDHLRTYLHNLGLSFHPRTIRAFHTSLKSTSSSPLVVLAGVSGTGKSELPRRYAEAIGMNFLNLAVQPRWDSPQDLFGFYDYLEQRFRPTELTRALIQMDQFYKEDNRGWDCPAKKRQENSRSSEMLLVLLDEMNLARVEYYFSEFLSRLETRRGINPKLTEERQKAEITFDVGGRQGVPPMRLFVGSNVLFVGTMNEDETTQALSDKVIDRANVLRFGSPASVDGIIAPAKNGQSHTAIGRIQDSTWSQDWIKEIAQLEPGLKRQMHDCIRKLRTAMDRVQRPFAYRVSQGMLEYAANYPEPQSHIGEIISDQIEQKILPRLRGVDPTDSAGRQAFEAIEEILRDTCHDELLIHHLNNCKRDNYFQWIGLDRDREEPVHA